MEDKKLMESVASLLKAGDKEALAQLLVEYTQPGHITTDIIGLLLNSRNLKPGK